ncbi:MAG: rhomboid family intramembrane serine protease [Rhodobacterales bacterium]|nr:rhomboid family intramembrane serine protease [Rhodobacterales bacterium]
MDQDHSAAPLNPVPLVVWALALPMIAMEVVLSLGASGVVGGPQAIGWRIQAVERFGLFPELLKYQWETGGYPLAELSRLVSYVLVHGSFTHALFAVVMLLALGNMVASVFRWWGVLVVFLGSTILGGAAYGLLVPGLRTQLIGAYPGIYGLIGAFTFLIWTRLALVGANRLRAFSLIGMLLAIQLVFGLLFGGGWDWVAEVAGFATGFLASFVVSPGGFARVVQMMRQR